MAIIINLDMILLKRKMKLVTLSKKIGISTVNLSMLKTNKVKGIRFSTLDAICKVLQCQPGDIIEYTKDGN
jgi:putative transcriptional regulator